jgi:hypothetical protein
MSVEPRRFEYVVWFRNLRLAPNDEDYEWPAVFAIDADTPDSARAWGDHLAHAYAARTGDIFVSSKVGLLLDETTPAHARNAEPLMPVVVYGHEASDEEIGW